MASRIDPYIFAAAAYVAAGVCALLVVVTLILAPRKLAWALASAIPVAVAFVVLSGYSWA
jgi:hypothetical protein